MGFFWVEDGKEAVNFSYTMARTQDGDFGCFGGIQGRRVGKRGTVLLVGEEAELMRRYCGVADIQGASLKWREVNSYIGGVFRVTRIGCIKQASSI